MVMEIVINQNNNKQNINIKQQDNQVLYIDGGGNIIGISNVLVNGKSVVSNSIAYVVVPTKVSELTNDSGYITSEQDPTVPSYVKSISNADINNWNNKQNALVSGSTIKTINNETLLGSGNINIEGTTYTAGTGININNNEISNEITSYNDLTDLPNIPTNTSELVNDSDFVISSDLSDVAFSGSYTDLSNTPEIPTELSELNNDVGYVKSTDISSYSVAGVLKSGEVNGFGVNSSGYAYCDTYTYADYLNKYPATFVGKGTLENVITGKGLIDKNVNDLTYYTTTANLPSVNDGTLTIQRNGTTLDTFTANSNTNKSINIIVPTKTSDLTNDDGFIDNTVNNLTNYTNNTNLGTMFNDFLKVEEVSANIGVIAPQSGLYDQTYSFTIPAGYLPIGIVGFRFTGTDTISLNLAKCYINSSNQLYYSIFNTRTSGNSTGSTSTLKAFILFKKS